METRNVAGLNITNTTKPELTEGLERRLKAGERTFVITPYSEFLYRSLKDPQLLETLNRADFSIPDGIGIFWASGFLKKPLTFPGYYPKLIQSLFQAAITLLRPGRLKNEFKEKIPGSDFIWDLASLAERNGWSIYLLGGFGDTPQVVADRLRKNYPNLTIAGWSNRHYQDPAILDDVRKAKPDMLLVAFGPITQEKFIVEHWDDLPFRLAIGLGGTFDYVAGKRKVPHPLIRRSGLEWLYRLVTQPHRASRIWQATAGLVCQLVKYKLYQYLPYRENVVSVVLNKANQVLIAKYNPQKRVLKALGRMADSFENYWQFPQGGMDEGEEIIDTAKRELWEETAIRDVELLNISEQTFSYTWNPSGRPLFVSRRFHFKGQRQHVAYLRFTGPESQIKLDLDEFLEYRWVPLDRLVDEVHEYKKPLARIALQDLKELLHP